MPDWTLQDVVDRIPATPMTALPVPPYIPPTLHEARVALAVESMRRHMTDEGWQIMAGLEANGYKLYGHGLPNPSTDLCHILHKELSGTMVVQDKREWDPPPRDFREQAARFHSITQLKKRDDWFKLTILKDAQQKRLYHRESAEEIGCHAWIVYYHPTIVTKLAPYVRPEHLLRTYHTVDATMVPAYQERQGGCLVSGAVSDVYPLRKRIVENLRQLPHTVHLKHPGYHRNGSHTPEFLRVLGGYKVALCTASCYGYALRKLIEATACGCRVITDLPVDEVLPGIDENLLRIHPQIHLRELAQVIDAVLATYDPDRQAVLAARARSFYDHTIMGKRLVHQIEALRQSYPIPA